MVPEDIPQSVVARVLQARIILNEYDANVEAAAIIAALQGEGYRLIRSDEATVARMAEAIREAAKGRHMEKPDQWFRKIARAALTAAQGDEDA